MGLTSSIVFIQRLAVEYVNADAVHAKEMIEEQNWGFFYTVSKFYPKKFQASREARITHVFNMGADAVTTLIGQEKLNIDPCFTLRDFLW